MNRFSAIALLAIAAVLTCTEAMAQQSGLRANIPFDFAIGDTWMPAGDYTISSPTQGVLVIKSGGHIASVMSFLSFNESKVGSQLVFNKLASQYYLHEVLCPAFASLNLRVASSAAEKRARQRVMEAKGPITGNKIMVAAR
jgi:hypothetical protein